MPFQEGNKLAAKGAPWRAALNRAISQDDGKRLRAAAEKLLDLAAEGEAWAVKELADRLDGRPAQSIDLEATGDFTVNIVSFGADGGTDSTA